MANSFPLLVMTMVVTLHTGLKAEEHVAIRQVVRTKAERVMFPCEIPFHSNKTPMWKVIKNGISITVLNNTVSVCGKSSRELCLEMKYKGDFNLGIQKVANGDEGTYKCILKGKGETATTTLAIYNLHITREVDITESAYTRVVSVREGGTAKLWCNATGFPAPSIYWTMTDHERTNADDTPVLHTLGINGSLLQIRNVSRHCGASYRCFAYNELSGDSPEYRDVTVRVEFGASADIDIYKDDHCGQIATDLGEKILDMKGNPYVEMSQLDQVSLLCSGSAAPNATLQWLKNGVAIATMEVSSEPVVLNEDHIFVAAPCPSLYKDERRLKITFRVVDDLFADYTCKATNFISSDEWTITIKKLP